MRKGFTRKPPADPPGPAAKNYITPGGLQRLREEYRFLHTRERPAVKEVVAWAASNGDRSENADYLYGKRRLRQIDSRLRFLLKRIEAAEVVDPEAPRSAQAASKIYFGATVRYADQTGAEHVISIVGADEVDLERRHISWLSPLGRALLKAEEGDRVVLEAPGGKTWLTVLEISYERIDVEPFRIPPGAQSAPTPAHNDETQSVAPTKDSEGPVLFSVDTLPPQRKGEIQTNPDKVLTTHPETNTDISIT
jgi:transcription elongation factor GreB